MSRMSRYLLVLTLACGLAMVACQAGNTTAPDPPPAANNYQVVTISDLHFNPLDDPSLYSQLVASDPNQWAGIFQGSKITAMTTAGNDTNYPLLQITLASVKQQMGNSPLVLITGDLLGHYIPSNFYTAYYQPASVPATPSPAAVTAMQAFIDKTVTFVALQIRAAAGSVPVMFAVGNIDTYDLAAMGPDTTFLMNNAQTFYTQFLGNSVDQQTFTTTFTNGGYYSAQLVGSNLMVIGLDTNSFVDGTPTNADANAELDWLNFQLAAAKNAGLKVWILMHVPPGANSQGTAQNAVKAGTPGEVSEQTTEMMWDPGIQETFLQTLENHPGVVTLMLAGHTHMDEYRILSTGNVLEQLPSISPCFGNNPAFKVFTIGQTSLTATDYQSYYFNLNSAPLPTQFSSLYQFSVAYSAQGSLSSSLQQLYPLLAGNPTQQNAYTLYYDSGSTALIPGTPVPWNPINSTTWPIFACTIGEMDELDYIQCVNTY
jgi:sphingomyelin phosphodiesterase acid-like 3